MTRRMLLPLSLALLASGCGRQVAPDPPELVVEDKVVGAGEAAKEGDDVGYWYTVRLLGSADAIDSNVGGKLYRVRIGEHKVIGGMEQGLVGMRVGGKRRLVIPSRLAYGEKGRPPKVPPNAPLEFDVELASIDAQP